MARRQLQYSIQTELGTKGWSLWGSGALSSRIKQALQENLPRQDDSTGGGNTHTSILCKVWDICRAALRGSSINLGLNRSNHMDACVVMAPFTSLIANRCAQPGYHASSMQSS